MSVTLNASTSSGLIATSDTSGVLALQANGTTVATAQSTGLNLASTGLVFSDSTTQTSGSGVAKAWVRYSVSGSTVTINAQYNVSSVTRSATGRYSASFTNALADGNYSMVAMASPQSDIFLVAATGLQSTYGTNSSTTAYCSITYPSGGATDPAFACFAFFR
jgi:hypothetical protein